MFQFSTNDKNSSARRAPYRMTALRHNPYVGSFHGLRIAASNTDVYFQDESVDKTENPSTELGLKRILYQKEEGKSSVLSQLKVSRVSTSFPVKRSFLASLKKIPLKVYSTSGGSKSSLSYHGDDPVCAICIEPYVDGDQLMTLSCSHCFHKECARKWFLQGCLNNTDANNSVNCPECRQQHQDKQNQQNQNQNHQRSLDAQSVVSGNGMPEISSASFLEVGSKLINEGGYDFMSDIGSETSRTTRSHSMANFELKADNAAATAAAGVTAAAPLVMSVLNESLSQLAVSGIVPSTIDSMSQADTAAPTVSSSSSLAYSSDVTTVTGAAAELLSEAVDASNDVTNTPAVVAVVEEAVYEQPAVEEDVGYTLGESTFSDCGYPLMMAHPPRPNAIPLNRRV